MEDCYLHGIPLPLKWPWVNFSLVEKKKKVIKLTCSNMILNCCSSCNFFSDSSAFFLTVSNISFASAIACWLPPSVVGWICWLSLSSLNCFAVSSAWSLYLRPIFFNCRFDEETWLKFNLNIKKKKKDTSSHKSHSQL